jgi:hypothetical protein
MGLQKAIFWHSESGVVSHYSSTLSNRQGAVVACTWRHMAGTERLQVSELMQASSQLSPQPQPMPLSYLLEQAMIHERVVTYPIEGKSPHLDTSRLKASWKIFPSQDSRHDPRRLQTCKRFVTPCAVSQRIDNLAPFPCAAPASDRDRKDFTGLKSV